jgi:hypothetical protein
MAFKTLHAKIVIALSKRGKWQEGELTIVPNAKNDSKI